MTILEDNTRRMIALWLMKSTTGSFSGRADRRFEKVREEIGAMLKGKEVTLPDDSGLIIKLGWRDEAIHGARKTNLALREFKEVNPEAYKQLDGIIQKHRSARRAYLEFGGEVSEEVYIEIIREIMGGIDYDTAMLHYQSMNEMGNTFGKKGFQTSLLSE
jgi:hypothetical protein